MNASTTAIGRVLTNFPTLEMNYWSLQKNAGIRMSDAGFVSVVGSGVMDFLNRLSTNDLSGLHPGDCRTTVLTTEKGKIIDLVTVISRENDILLVVSQGSTPALQRWLEKFVIMENIVINDFTASFAGIEFFGSDATSIIEKLTDTPAEIHDTRVRHVVLDGDELLCFQDPLWKRFKHVIVGSHAAIRRAWNRVLGMTNNGTVLQTIPPEVFELMRIERGIPLYGKELTLEINPLEAGLNDFVNFSKGCYIGQEVIARLDTYRKLQKRLSGFILDDVIRELPSSPCKVFQDGMEVGFTTSHSWSFQIQRLIALGYLKISVQNGDINLITPDGQTIKTRASRLPFATAHHGLHA